MQRRQRAEDAGVADEDVELAPARKQRRPELIELVALGKVDLQQRRLAAALADLVVELFQGADGARGDDDVGAVLGEGDGHGATDAARGAGHECEPVFERFLVFHDHVHGLAHQQRRLASLSAAASQASPTSVEDGDGWRVG